MSAVKVLIAEDEAVSRARLEAFLSGSFAAHT